ncbi:hypothetical protein [Geotalea toluenoxydans]|uniref:hypothetical protein n=1 Tax=Geotalea toluenoxydans TaxID=421624 RepID=UPI000A77425D|nr:hypothetical protein [Geotalea toluenoxydans]
MEDVQNQRRLCTEIQLFDLCDRDACSHRDGRYCTKGDILAKFEAIKEEDERSPEQFMAEELDDTEAPVTWAMMNHSASTNTGMMNLTKMICNCTINNHHQKAALQKAAFLWINANR